MPRNYDGTVVRSKDAVYRLAKYCRFYKNKPNACQPFIIAWQEALVCSWWTGVGMAWWQSDTLSSHNNGLSSTLDWINLAAFIKVYENKCLLSFYWKKINIKKVLIITLQSNNFKMDNTPSIWELFQFCRKLKQQVSAGRPVMHNFLKYMPYLLTLWVRNKQLARCLYRFCTNCVWRTQAINQRLPDSERVSEDSFAALGPARGLWCSVFPMFFMHVYQSH